MIRPVVVRAEMFGQLTTGLESAWNKLKGEGFSFLSLFQFNYNYLLTLQLPLSHGDYTNDH